MEKKVVKSIQDQLLSAREEGLSQIHERESIQALGKFRGMDAFSWHNPHLEKLSTMLNSFPFKVIWIGHRMQIKCVLKYYPEVLSNVESIIVYDDSFASVEDDAFVQLKNIIAVGDVQSALAFISALEENKKALLFTAEGEGAIEHINHFKTYTGH